MTNPLKDLRQSLGLTLEDVALGADISRMAVIRNEQGCYSKPSPALLKFYLLHTEIDRLFLQRYQEFQNETRQANYGKLDPGVLKYMLRISTSRTHVDVRVFNESLPHPAYENPVMSWRVQSHLSKAKISTCYCIHPDIISRIECRPHLVPVALPKQFLDALLISGYDKDDLDGLNVLFRQYREVVNSHSLNPTFIGEAS